MSIPLTEHELCMYQVLCWAVSLSPIIIMTLQGKCTSPAFYRWASLREELSPLPKVTRAGRTRLEFKANSKAHVYSTQRKDYPYESGQGREGFLWRNKVRAGRMCRMWTAGTVLERYPGGPDGPWDPVTEDTQIQVPCSYTIFQRVNATWWAL